MGDYSRHGEEAVTSFMAKVAARGDALEAAAAARFNQFRGLPADGVVSEETVAAVAERAGRTASRTMGTASSGPRSRLSNPDRPGEDPQTVPVTFAPQKVMAQTPSAPARHAMIRLTVTPAAYAVIAATHPASGRL